MPADPPFDFEAAVRQGSNPGAGGYPYQLSSADLMRNFVYATPAIDTADGNLLVETSQPGMNGHVQRVFRVALPDAPTSGTYVLGAVNGVVQWLATEDCN